MPITTSVLKNLAIHAIAIIVITYMSDTVTIPGIHVTGVTAYCLMASLPVSPIEMPHENAVVYTAMVINTAMNSGMATLAMKGVTACVTMLAIVCVV